MGRISISLSVVLVAAFLWSPVRGDKCSITCQGSPTSHTFLNGHKYSYGVEGTVTVFLTGADKQETSIKLLGQVSVAALGNCAHELTVQNLAISGPDSKKYPSPAGLDKPVRFSYQDGRIGPEICTTEGDSRRSLNIKRAIISLLQNEQKPTTQVDIFGACPTEVSSSQEGSAVLVHRSRDLSRCANREQNKNDLISAIYNPTSEIKESQILQSTLNVESKVNGGVPEKVVATEEYLYKPFSVGQNGARAKVYTKLVLTGKSQGGASSSHCIEARGIIFEVPHGAELNPNNAQVAVNAVKETAKNLEPEANSKSAGNFAQLIRILRATSKDDLIKVFNQVKSQNLQKRVFLDGLLRAGSGDSIEASIQILKTNTLGEFEKQLVYLSLGNAKHVTNAAIQAAAGLLDQPDLPKEVYLGVGALAGAFCREHQCHKAKNNGIVTLSNKLASKLQNCKPQTKVEEDNVIAVLKGIRNIRHLEDSLIDKLVRGASENNKARVRVAVLEAFHADPCSHKIKKTSIALLKDRQLDSEIRINAYLAVIACPCASSATEIKNLLQDEPVNQVGYFIVSSLRHIRASTNPDKKLARQHYGLIGTPNKFQADDRKFSFYREASFNLDALGVGGSIDQTVIYSQNSFLPRSVSVNLTTEIFGHSYNVFEFGGRQGNLDLVVEHFLGPKGLFRSKNPQELYDDLVKKSNEAYNKLYENLKRGRRSIKSEIENFDKALKAESTPYNNELDLDIYLKLFGTDAIFLSLGDNQGFDTNKLLDYVIKIFNQGVNQAKHFSQELRANILFLDAELSYPTSTGLPLKLDLVGSATSRFDVSSNIDIRQCLQSPQNAKIDFKLVPSMDIEVSGLFIVDADVVATGLKVVNNLHSSTGAHFIFKVLENGKGFDLQLGLPIDKQEILTASNDLVYVTAERGQKEKQIPIKVDVDKKEYSACFDQLSGFLGLTVCSEVYAPFSVSGQDAQASISKFLARYPLSGPSKVKIVVDKNDLRGYHIKGLVRSEKNGQKQSFELLFDAEGSKNRRSELSGEVIASETELSLKLSLNTPIKTAFLKVGGTKSPSELTAVAQAKIDELEYFGRVGFNIQGNRGRSVYKPLLEYSIPGGDGRQSIKLDGQVVAEASGNKVKYTLSGIKLQLSKDKPVEVEGYYSQQEQPFQADFDINVKDHASLKGALKGNDGSIEFRNSFNPYVNFKADGHFEYSGPIHNKLNLIYSGDLKDNNNRVSFEQLLKYHFKTSEDFNIISKNSFEIAAVPFKVKANVDVDPKKVDVELGGECHKTKALFDLEARTQIKKQGDYSVKVEAVYDQNGFEAKAKREIISTEKSNVENVLDVKGIGKYELSGVVIHKLKQNDIHVGTIGHLKISAAGKSEDIKFDIGAVENPSRYSSHAKISSTKGDLLDYLFTITRGANLSGQLKLTLKDTIAANGQFKVTDSDGKGNGAIIVDFKKSHRKIKGDVKFLAKDPVFNADVDLYLNYEKDNNDKIYLSTNTKNTEKQYITKNKLVYGGKTTEVNFNRDGVLTLSGKTKAELEIVLPTERCLNFKVNRDVTVNDGVTNGHAEVVFSDAAKRGGAASTISYKGKVVNTDIDKDTIDYEGAIDLKLAGGKSLQNVFALKNIPQGDKFKFDFKTEVTGNVLSKPAALVANAVYSAKDDSFDDIYYLKGHYGDDYSFEYDEKLIVQLFEKGDKKYLDDFTLKLRLPLEKAKNIKWVSNVLFLTPEGQEEVEYTFVQLVEVDEAAYKVDATGKVSCCEGSTTIKLLVPNQDPMILDAKFKSKKSGEKTHNGVEVKAKYGKGKSAAIALDGSLAPHDSTLVLKVSAPEADKLKKLELSVHSKNPAPDSYSSAILVDADGRVYRTEASVVLSKAHPVLDIKHTNPGQKPSRVYVKGSSVSSTQGKVEAIIENVYGHNLQLNTETNIQKDSLAFKVYANSPELGLKNAVAEVSTKDEGSGKRLQFLSTNDGANVLSGSTTFTSKQEGTKTIVDGSGSLKYKNEQKSANVKYIRTLLSEKNEKGVETFFNLGFGDRSYVGESRITNLEFKISHVYCQEKKQCANAELISKIDISNKGKIVNVVSANFDLRKLGVAPEFGLNIKDEISENRLPQYNLDLHVNKDEKTYHLKVYSTPDFGNAKSGITINLPQRTITLESSATYPKDTVIPFPLKGEISFDLDKTKGGRRAAARYSVDVNLDDFRNQYVNAEFGLSLPRIDELVCKFNGHLARPNDKTIKIESAASVKHSCFGREREAKLFFEASPQTLKFFINTPLVQVVDFKGTSQVTDKLQKLDFEFRILASKPVSVTLIAKEFQYYEFTTAEADRKLSIIGHIQPEKRVDISADIILAGQKKNIGHGGLFLENNQVKSDFGVSQDNFKYYTNALSKDLDELQVRIKNIGDKAGKDIEDIYKRAQSSYKKAEQVYNEDIKKFYSELANDKTLKELSLVFHEVLQFVVKVIDDILMHTKPIADQISQVYIATVKNIVEAYQRDIQPEIKKLYETIGGIFKEALTGVVEVVAHFAALVQDFLDKHKVEFQELTNTFTEIFKDLTRLTVVQLKEIRARVDLIFETIVLQIKEQPLFQNIVQKLGQLTADEQVIAAINNGYQSIAAFLPTPESREFTEALKDYIIKKLKHVKFEENKELRVLYQKLVVTLVSFARVVRGQLDEIGVSSNQFNPSFFLPNAPQSAPALSGSASFSLIQQVLAGDFPDLLSLFRAYRPRSLNPLDEVPAKLRAVIVNGQHIFTFDGRHLTFPGTCRYVLVHDHVDRNFTLLLQAQNGQPKALVLEDKSGAVIEVKDNGQVILNGAAHGFPVSEKDSFAFKQASGRIGLGTSYGLITYCTSKLEVCYVEVSGFYLGKLRGLLGDGNNEPFDDFRLPNGKISKTESEFGNAYRLARSCPEVQVPSHEHHQLHQTHLPAACEQVFGGSSPLRRISLVLNLAPFRQACIHAVTGKNEAEALHQACDLGRGYVALAVTGLVPAVLPAVCVQCNDGDKPRKVGETFEVKLPNKQADIVINVETTVSNENNFKNLVVPLVSQLVDSLKSKHITDIKVYLVGITSSFPYPILYDTDLKLKNAKVRFTDKDRYNLAKPINTGFETFDNYQAQAINILNSVLTQFGLTNVAAGYSSVLSLPLRAGAVKHVINVVGEKCHAANFLFESLRSTAYQIVFDNIAYSHSVVSSGASVKIGNGKDASQLIGYSNKAVYLLGDKKANKDSEALRATITHENDACINFVEKTNGFVFLGANYAACNQGQQKQFLATAVGAIVNELTRETRVQECKCMFVDPFRVSSVCKNKSTKETAQRRK